ncbi:response regulator, partial [bacterium]|nr:response regulator [bacterium]
MKILIVEDYEPLRTTVVKGLRDQGYAVDETGDGREGKWFIESGDHDVVILDLMLPGLDGLALLRSIRNAGNRSHVLITSARDTVEQRIEGLDLGADDYLVKPFSLEELFARIRSIIRRKYDR